MDIVTKTLNILSILKYEDTQTVLLLLDMLTYIFSTLKYEVTQTVWLLVDMLR